MRRPSAAALGAWLLIAFAGLAGTLAFTAVRASRSGCAEPGLANVIAVTGLAGFGLAVTTLLLVGANRRYRSTGPAVAAIVVLALSAYALVSFLARDSAACF